MERPNEHGLLVGDEENRWHEDWYASSVEVSLDGSKRGQGIHCSENFGEADRSVRARHLAALCGANRGWTSSWLTHPLQDLHPRVGSPRGDRSSISGARLRQPAPLAELWAVEIDLSYASIAYLREVDEGFGSRRPLPPLSYAFRAWRRLSWESPRAAHQRVRRPPTRSERPPAPAAGGGTRHARTGPPRAGWR